MKNFAVKRNSSGGGKLSLNVLTVSARWLRKGSEQMIAADDLALRFHARYCVWRSHEQNVLQRVACGAGVDEMAADGLRFYARCRVWRQNEQNVLQRVAYRAGIYKMAADEPRFYARDRVWRQNKEKAVRRVACIVGMNGRSSSQRTDNRRDSARDA